jgi:tellurite resistance-related uncharacterized protein
MPPQTHDQARIEFRRMLRWIAVAGVAMVAASLWYLSLFGALTVHMIVATVMGVFFSVLLGSGLFAAAFFSSKSGHDQNVTDATKEAANRYPNPIALPDGIEAYRRTDDFTETTVPTGLLTEHRTKAESWGLIHVREGRLRYRVTDERRQPLDVILTPETPPGIVEPTIVHYVEPLGPTLFHVEFWREPIARCREEILARRENRRLKQSAQTESPPSPPTPY